MTRHFAPAAALLALVLAAQPALAEKGGNVHSRKHGHDDHRSAAFCPPGLAKKSPACVPPGQAKAYRDDRDHDGRYHVRIGDRVDRRFVLVEDPRRYRLDPTYRYYRYGGELYRVDPQTLQVIAILGLVDALLN